MSFSLWRWKHWALGRPGVGEHSSLDCPSPHPSPKETSNTPQSMNFKYRINRIRSHLYMGLAKELRVNPARGLWDVQEECLLHGRAVGRHLLRNIQYLRAAVARGIIQGGRTPQDETITLPGWKLDGLDVGTHAQPVFRCNVLSKGLFSFPLQTETRRRTGEAADSTRGPVRLRVSPR